jgi:hypothetical protein
MIQAVCVPARPGRYRYWLELPLLASGPPLAVIMKNPSTATAERSDPTVGKTSAWARCHGFGRLIIVNLFAWRATAPEAINLPPYARAVGAHNDRYLVQAAAQAAVLVAGWGNANGITATRYVRRVAEVRRLLAGRLLWRVGAPTQAGQPRHGLWWPAAEALQLFDISG